MASPDPTAPGGYGGGYPPQQQQQQMPMYPMQMQQQPPPYHSPVPAGPYATGPYNQPYMTGPPQPQLQQPQQQYYQSQPVYGGPTSVSSVVVVEQAGYIPTSSFGRLPTTCCCPNCHAQVITAVTYSPGATAWLACGAMMLLGCWPLACVPFCMTSMQDVEHGCPNCGIVIRRRSAMDD